MATRLFDLFGDFSGSWPAAALRDHIGADATPWNPAPWLSALNDSLEVTDIRTGANADGAAIQAQPRTTGYLTYPVGWPFSFALDAGRALPRAAVRDPGPVDRAVRHGRRRRRRARARGRAGRDPAPERPGRPLGQGSVAIITSPVGTVGTFTAGVLDSLRIDHHEHEPTSIFVHVRCA